jgi:hypothetical protein
MSLASWGEAMEQGVITILILAGVVCVFVRLIAFWIGYELGRQQPGRDKRRGFPVEPHPRKTAKHFTEYRCWSLAWRVWPPTPAAVGALGCRFSPQS